MADQPVGSFFDKNAASYHERKAGMQFHHSVIAQRIEAQLSGDVLSIGGLWNERGEMGHLRSLTVVDLSLEMLRAYEKDGVRTMQADATNLPFDDDSFDHLVFPLILHHIAGSSAGEAQAGVHAALREAHRVLKPGGTVWISEFCVASALYLAELAAVPATRQLLGLIKTPLVVMHSKEFFAEALHERGFSSPAIEQIKAHDASPLDLITPVIGVSILKLPRFLYPIHPTLFHATAT